MLKQVSICATLVLLGTIPLAAQQQEAVLQQVELPGAGFDLVLATPKSPAATIELGDSPDALIFHLTGGKLALVFEDGRKMLDAFDLLQYPGCAFQAKGDDGKSAKPVSVYIVPKRETSTATIRTASLDVQLSEVGMRKIKIPEGDFNIVYATTKAPIAWEPYERLGALAIYSTGDELIMATDRDLERMFKDVGLSQWPSCAFHMEHKNSSPSQAASVYIVPEGDTPASASR